MNLLINVNIIVSIVLFSKIGMRMAIHLYEIAFDYNCKYCSAKFFLAKFAFNLYEFIGQDS